MIRFLDEDKESDVEEMNTETKPLRTQDVESVFDEPEIARQREVASHIVHAMEGCLPLEQVDPSQLHIALEVGCGTGDWVRAVAQASPSIQVFPCQSSVLHGQLRSRRQTHSGNLPQTPLATINPAHVMLVTVVTWVF